MPGFDGTGPLGQGPMTGRGLGNCNPNAAGYGAGRGLGRGMGRGFGRGMGRGFRRGFGPAYAGPVYQAGDAENPQEASRIEQLEMQVANLTDKIESLVDRYENRDNKR